MNRFQESYIKNKKLEAALKDEQSSLLNSKNTLQRSLTLARFVKLQTHFVCHQEVEAANLLESVISDFKRFNIK